MKRVGIMFPRNKSTKGITKPFSYSFIFPSFLTSLMLVPSSYGRHSFCRVINLSKHCTQSYYVLCGSSCLHFCTRTYTAQILVHMSVVGSIVVGLIFFLFPGLFPTSVLSYFFLIMQLVLPLFLHLMRLYISSSAKLLDIGSEMKKVENRPTS